MATFILRSPLIRANAAEALRKAPDGYSVTIDEPQRSKDQNKMFHAICTDIAKSRIPFAGKPRPARTWKVLLVSAHAAETGEGSEVVPGLEGEFVNIRESTALMSVKRAASLITYALSFCDTNDIPLNETRRGGFFAEEQAA
jgi:hypothetical protein